MNLCSTWLLHESVNDEITFNGTPSPAALSHAFPLERTKCWVLRWECSSVASVTGSFNNSNCQYARYFYVVFPFNVLIKKNYCNSTKLGIKLKQQNFIFSLSCNCTNSLINFIKLTHISALAYWQKNRILCKCLLNFHFSKLISIFIASF